MLEKELNFFKQQNKHHKHHKKISLAMRIFAISMGLTFIYTIFLLIGLICSVFSDSMDSSYQILTQEESNLHVAMKDHNEKNVLSSLYLLSKTHYYGMPHIDIAKEVRLSRDIKNIVESSDFSSSLKLDVKQLANEFKLNHPEQFEQEMNHYYSCSTIDPFCHYFRDKDLKSTHQQLQKELPIFKENMTIIKQAAVDSLANISVKK